SPEGVASHCLTSSSSARFPLLPLRAETDRERLHAARIRASSGVPGRLDLEQNSASMAETPVPAGEVTRLLMAWRHGDRDSLEKLIPRVYDDLHRMAERHFRRERAGHTLQPTAIVNELYLRLAGGDGDGVSWQNRAHFFAAAARTMRHILVDHARTR